MRLNPKLLVGLGLLLVLGYFFKDLVWNDDQYAAHLRQARQAKNDAFRRANDSPLETAEREKFDSLKYYAPNKDYRFEAQLEPFPQRDTVQLPLTTGGADRYLRWGRASFILNQQEYKLTLYRKADGQDSTLFVPFTDRTNGRSTYGGGRYLDTPLPAPDDPKILLDFNAAYNPYCAYSAAYACPVPPADNRLAVEIPVGEKTYH